MSEVNDLDQSSQRNLNKYWQNTTTNVSVVQHPSTTFVYGYNILNHKFVALYCKIMQSTEKYFVRSTLYKKRKE